MSFINRNAVVIACSIFVIACVQQSDVTTQEKGTVITKVPTEAGERQKSDESDALLITENIPEQESIIAADASVTDTLQRAERKIAPGKRNKELLMKSGNSVQYGVASSPVAPALSALSSIRQTFQSADRENYAHFEDNPLKRVSEHLVSTFSIDVDTGAYSNVRRILMSGRLPAQNAVRAEEMINYFNYAYPLPENRATPFAVHREIGPSPWDKNTHLLHIGIKGYDVADENIPPANLVFLVDVSGSMQSANKLELLKSSLNLLTRRLEAEDSVSIVVYAGSSGVVLEPTTGDRKAEISAALEQLHAGGSTNGEAGIRLAYAMAEKAFIKDGINRVLLATDGDFNVGTTGIEQLKNLIEEKRKSGIALSTLGFGTGNYNDHLMEQLADIGNGNYAYIDTLNEARKVLVEELTSTMLTIAKDVKIQIEFNPALVSEYRLIGYENRTLKREDFNNDKVDAGEIGAGHNITAIYEISLSQGNGDKIDPLRYQSETLPQKNNDEIAFLKLRYKDPGQEKSELLTWKIGKSEIKHKLAENSETYRFSAAVAAFAQNLRGGEQLNHFSYADIRMLARDSRGADEFGYRNDFVNLVKLAEAVSTPEKQVSLVQ